MVVLVLTSSGALAVQALEHAPAWRVGFRPQPWAWTPWEFAPEAGHFTGRWDDPAGSFRTIYAGETLLACLLEVLACFRPDPRLEEDLAVITEDGGRRHRVSRVGYSATSSAAATRRCAAQISSGSPSN